MAIVGSAVDCLLFDGPTTFQGRYSVRPPGLGSLATKAGKAWKINQGDRVIVPRAISGNPIDVYQTVLQIYQCEPAAEIIVASESQISLVWQDPETGLMCKGRPDLVSLEGPPYDVWDLKVTLDVSMDAFARKIAEQGWQRLVWYLDGLTELTGEEHNALGFIAAERHPPFGVEVYRLGMASMEIGRAQNRDALDKISYYSDLGTWPTSSNIKRTIDLPYWELRKHEALTNG